MDPRSPTVTAEATPDSLLSALAEAPDRPLLPEVLGSYRVVRWIGAGGMGQVYEALDVRLERPVALKVLPPELGDDPDRLRRFAREARAASALNHPNIVTVYDVGEAQRPDGPPIHYIVLELCEGGTLRDVLREERPVPVLLGLLAQVADGLAKAHAAGIVHRDLKPENVLLSADGVPKIGDFGIAKLRGAEVPPGAAGEPAGTVHTHTRGMVGTPGYMSPEQVRGEPVDARSDLFSFGCILYEALARRPPFRGSTLTETAERILHAEPPPLPKQRGVSWALRRVLGRCLEKDPARRYAGAAELAAALRSDPAPAPVQVTRLTSTGNAVTAALSPDGTQVAYATSEGDRQTLWLRPIDTARETRLVEARPSHYPHVVFSPDGTWVYFTASAASLPTSVSLAHVLYRVPSSGGAVQRLLEGVEHFAVAANGSRIAFVRSDPSSGETAVFLAAPDGSSPRRLVARRAWARLGELTFSSDGRTLVLSIDGGPDAGGSRLVRADLSTAEERPFSAAQWEHVWSVAAVGEELLVAARTFRGTSQIFRARAGEAAPVPITRDENDYYHMSATPDGRRLIAVQRDSRFNVWRVRPGDPDGAQPITRGGADYARFTFAPDGSLVVSSREEGSFEVWIYSADGRLRRRVTQDGPNYQPVVSPDGRMVIVAGSRKKGISLWRYDIDSREGRPITSGPMDIYASFSPDGRSLFYTSLEQGKFWVKCLPLGGGRPVRVSRVPAGFPRPSPDGRVLAYTLLGGTGPVTIELSTLEGEPIGKRIPMTPTAWSHFLWSADGKEIYYIDHSGEVGNVFAQAIAGGPRRALTRFRTERIKQIALAPDGSLGVMRGVDMSDLVEIGGLGR
jgi:serine/threonine protein kinase